MIARIRQYGKSATFDGAEWTGDEHLVSLCRMLQEFLPFAYYPDRVREIAPKVASQLEDAALEFSGEPPPKPDVEGQIIY